MGSKSKPVMAGCAAPGTRWSGDKELWRPGGEAAARVARSNLWPRVLRVVRCAAADSFAAPGSRLGGRQEKHRDEEHCQLHCVGTVCVCARARRAMARQTLAVGRPVQDQLVANQAEWGEVQREALRETPGGGSLGCGSDHAKHASRYNREGRHCKAIRLTAQGHGRRVTRTETPTCLRLTATTCNRQVASQPPPRHRRGSCG
eukprot:scaffold21154_cov35-Phaeocystis_antarctica.AAC.1